MEKNYIYSGNIRHRRFTPFKQSFNYKIFMTFFDISKIDNLFEKSILWNINNPALISFNRKDYHGDPSLSLDKAVRKTIKEKTGKDINGPIRILTHLRYFGYCFNPVSFYYCYNSLDTDIELIMAEVTNTPWNERHSYFIENRKDGKFIEKLKKEFHVSPFWDMKHDYEWIFSLPAKSLNVNMKNFKSSKKVFDATLTLNKRIEMNFYNLLISTFKLPFLTLMVYFRIHFQAFKLLIKGATFFSHPKYKN